MTLKEAEDRGLYRKFDVRRTDGKDRIGEKHCGCCYFVLDLTHDPHAIPALRAYANSCKQTHPALSDDLKSIAGGNHLMKERTILDMPTSERSYTSPLCPPSANVNNDATRLVDEERRRWYTALQAEGATNLEGLAPEVVASQIASTHKQQLQFAADESHQKDLAYTRQISALQSDLAFANRKLREITITLGYKPLPTR